MAKSVTRNFDEDLIKDIVWDDHDEYEVIENDMVDKSRWSVHYEVVFKELATGKFYSVGYSRGATEYQDEGCEFDVRNGTVECQEVEPVEVKIIKFKPVLAA